MIDTRLISVEGEEYRSAMPVGAVSEVATVYPFLGKLQRRLMVNDDGDADFDALAAERVAKVALRWGGGKTEYDSLPNILVAQSIALNALQMAFDIDPEDEVKAKKKAAPKKRSTSEISSE